MKLSWLQRKLNKRHAVWGRAVRIRITLPMTHVVGVAFLGILLLLAAGCDDVESPTATFPPADTPTTAPTDTPIFTKPTDTPTSAGPTDTPPAAKGGGPAVTLNIGTPDDNLRYDTDKFEVKAGQTVTLRYENNSSVFKHNWVLVQGPPDTRDDVARDGLPFPENDYVKPGDERVVVFVKLVDPGATGEVTFPAPPAGNYEFVCTWPGHNTTKFGDFIVT